MGKRKLRDHCPTESVRVTRQHGESESAREHAHYSHHANRHTDLQVVAETASEAMDGRRCLAVLLHL